MRKMLTAVVVVVASVVAGLSAQPRSAAVGKDVTVLGFKLHYLEAGRGAPVVLLLGFGHSDKPLANYHTGMLADFLVGFLKAVGVPKASLVGNSMGAGVALYTAAKFPQAVDRIVLADGGGYRSPAAGPPPAPTPEALHRRQIQNSVTREETREFFRILLHDKSLVTDRMVDDQLQMRLRSA